jgi:hypothetical protein
MTYACPTWEFAADTHHLKLQRLQNKVLRTIAKFPKCSPVREVQMAFQVPDVYDYMTIFCRQKVEDIQNHENSNVRDIGKGEATHKM